MNGEGSGQAPHVVAVVLTWKDTEMSARCIQSVLDNSYARKSVVLVDNGTEPPACPVLKEQFPGIETVQLDRNTGFTGGCNRGMERALELGADYILLLNNDTIVHADAMDRLVEALEARPDVGMASAVIIYPGEEKKIQFYKGVLHRDCARHTHPGEGELLGDAHRETIATEFAPACGVMFRGAALKEVGLFDETLFTNWEDYDLCCRLQDGGWKLLTVGQAEIVHAHGQTTGRISPFITYFFTRNRLICLFRHGRLGGILRNAPFFLRTVYWQMRSYGFTNWPTHRAFVKGVVHFLLGIRGEGGAPGDTKDRRAKKSS